MRRLAASILIAACLAALAGCDSRGMDWAIAHAPRIEGVVEVVSEDALLIEGESGEYWVSLDVENEDSMTHFAEGDTVVVYYDGTVAESYPMQIHTVYAITLETPAHRSDVEV